MKIRKQILFLPGSIASLLPHFSHFSLTRRPKMKSGWKESKVRETLLGVALGVGVLISLLIAGVPNPARAGQATDLELAAKKEGRLRMVVFPSIRPPAEAFE